MSVVDDISVQPWVQHLGWTLVQFLWQGTVISALFATTRALLRRQITPRARYIFACVTLGLMVAAPCTTFVVRLNVPQMTAWGLPSPNTWRIVLPWLVGVWLCGVAAFSARLVGGWRATARLRSVGVRPAHVEWERTLERLILRLRVSRPVRLLISSFVEIPVVIGWWRPVILVPVGALTGLPPAYVEALLAHELAHVSRFDYLVNLLQSLAEAALFYHPAVWWVSDQIRAERELCCDDLAVAASGDALTYAHALAALESHRPAHAHALAASGGSLIDRIRRLLGQATPVSHTLPGPSAAGTMSVLWLLGMGVAGTHAAPRPLPSRLSIEQSSAAERVDASIAIEKAPVEHVEQLDRSAPQPRILSTLLFGPAGPVPVASAIQQEPRAQTPQTAGKTTASLAGAVSADSGKPVARAHVVIGAKELRETQEMLTDDAGRYTFTDLPAGSYTITASKAGYYDAIFGQKAPPHAGTPVTLADGQRIDHLDIKLSKGGVISGLLVDENGDPAPDTQVQAMRYDWHTGERQLVMQASSQTDDRGIYRIYNLPQGIYVVAAVPKLDTDRPSPTGGRAGGGGRGGRGGPLVTASPPAFSAGPGQRVDHVPVYFPGTTSCSSAGAIAVGLGEEKTGNDFQLQLVPTAKLQGTIAGLDFPDANYTLAPGMPLPPALGAPPGLSMQLLNADASTCLVRTAGGQSIVGNRFTFGSVPPGRYLIELRGSKPAANGGRRGGAWGELPVTVDGHNQDNLLITMQDGMTIGGHLSVDPHATGTPPDLGRIVVTLLGDDGIEGSFQQLALRPHALSDPSGHFAAIGVLPGTYTVQAQENVFGPRSWKAKSVMVNGKDALDFGLQVRGGEAPGDLEIVLTNTSTRVSGTLRDANGRPTTGHTVIVFAADSQYWLPQSRRIQAIRPGTDGKFSINGLPPGEYLIAAVADIETGQWYDPALLQQLKAQATSLHLSDGDQKTQDLRVSGGS